MAVHQPLAVLREQADVVAAPQGLRRRRTPRPFDLHPAVHAMVIGTWFAFVGILSATFMGPDLMIPAAIFVIGVAALFVTPGLWNRVAAQPGRRQSWSEFKADGVDCHTGHLTANEAMAQILILPGMILGLALFFAVLKTTL